MFRKTILASALALSLCSAFAADFYVVVPVKGRTTAPAAENITVSLASAVPTGATVGTPYAFDLSPYLQVTGDSAFSSSGVSWSVLAPTSLPAGLTLTSGIISGTPTTPDAGTAFQVQAAYKGKSSVQSYTIPVKPSCLDASLVASKTVYALTGDYQATNPGTDDRGNAITYGNAGGRLPQVVAGAGKNGTHGFYFNNTYLNWNNSSFTIPAGEDFFVEMWFKLDRTPASPYGPMLFETRPNQTNGSYITSGLQSNQTLHFTHNSVAYIANPTVASINAWSHYMLTRKNGVVRLYVNGQFANLTDTTNTALSSSTFSLGRHAFINVAGTSHWTGYIDSMRFVRGAGYGADFTLGCAWDEQ